MTQEIKTWYCRKCEQEKAVSKFKIRRRRTDVGRLIIDNVCMACRGKAETARLRLEMLNEFGWKCMCCGEDRIYFLTLQHIQGGRHFYGRKDKVPAHRVQTNTYQEIRRAKREGWDRTKWELLCINCNFAHGHFGECPHRSGVTNEQVISALEKSTLGIGRDESIRKMVEGGKATRYQEGQERPEMLGNKFAAHLTEDQVRQIKMLRDSGKLQREVAAQFGVSRQLIGLLWSDKRWKELQVN